MKREKRKNLQVLGAFLIISISIFVSGYQGIQNSLSAAPELKPWVDFRNRNRSGWLVFRMPTPRETNQTNFFQTVLSQTTTYNIQPSETMKVIDRYGNVTIIAWWDEPQPAEFVATTETVMRIKIDRTPLKLSDPFPISEDLLPEETKFYIESEKYTNWEDDAHNKCRILNMIQPDDPEVKSLAKKLSQGCKKEIEVVNKIANWISENIMSGKKCMDVVSYNPAWVLENKTARCVGFSNLMIALLRENNIPARLVYGIEYRKKLVQTNPGHCWVEIYFPEVGWVQYDPTTHSEIPSCIPFKVLRDYSAPELGGELFLRTDWSYRSRLGARCWNTKVQITDLENNTIKVTWTVSCKPRKKEEGEDPPVKVFREEVGVGDKNPRTGWVKGIPNAPVMKPPFEKELAAGEILRVKVENGKALKASGTGKIYRFKDGKPLAGVEPANPSGGTTYLYDSCVEADEYVIYSKGGGKIKVAHGDMPEASVVEGTEFKLSLKPKRLIVGRFVNINKGESQFVYSFLKGDKVVSKAPLKFRTKTLKTQGSFKRFTWETDADSIVVKVTKGRVQVKVGQPFPKKS